MEAESKQARSHSIWSASPRRFKSTRCRRSQSPASCHSRNRRQHVTPEPQPISWGNISQGMPLFSTKMMPVRAARSSTRGLPPCGLGDSGGSSSSITSHSSSLTNSLAIFSTYPDPVVLKGSLRTERAELLTGASALVYRHVVYVTGACVDLARTGYPEVGVVDHLHPLGHPTRGAWYGEHDGEGVRRYPEGFVDEARVEVDVGIELAAREVVVVERLLFELDGDVEQRALLVRGLENLVDVAADDPGPRIVVLVHPVPEAHETFVTLLDALEEVGDVLDTSYALEHPENRNVGPAVQRSVEPGAACGDGREGVDPRRPDDPYGRG